jgi:hypothetical protein
MRPGRLAAAVALILTLGSAACDNQGGVAEPLEVPPGVQAPSAIADDAPDRVEKSMLSNLSGLTPIPLDPEYSDDIASSVCGNKRGPRVYTSSDGMRREWQGPQTRVHQFTGAFGAVTAAQAIEQVGTMLGCGSYQVGREDGTYSNVHRVTVPSTTLAFCETVNGKNAACTGFLSRDDILVRIMTVAADEATATKLLGDVAPEAAETLTRAW